MKKSYHENSRSFSSRSNDFYDYSSHSRFDGYWGINSPQYSPGYDEWKSCFECGEVGHIAAYCPCWYWDDGYHCDFVEYRSCYNCGEFGNLVATCPYVKQKTSEVNVAKNSCNVKKPVSPKPI